MSKSLRIVVITLAGFIAYANSLRGGFVLDDKPIIVENAMIRKLSYLPRLLTENYWNGGNALSESPRGGLYRPLPLLTYALNYQAGGLRAWSYHGVNLALHLAISVLLYLLLMKMKVPGQAALSAALAFSVLPVHAEAVSSIVGRAELLSALFVLWAWFLAFGSESKTKILAALSCFGLALLSKESSAAFPLALALSEGALGGGSWSGAARKRGPVWAIFAMAVAFYLYWRRIILGRVFDTGGGAYFAGKGSLSVLLTMSHFFLRRYLWPMLTGLGLCADFSRPQIPDVLAGQPLGWFELFCAGTLIVYAFAALFRAKNPKALGACVFFTLLFPVSNVLFRIDLIGAERFLYLPSVGFCLLLGLIWEDIRPQAGPLLGVAVLVWWTAAAVQRNADWRSEESLWAATVRAVPNSPRAWNGLGAARQGSQARRCFARALQLDPAYPEAMYNLGKSLFDDGEYEEARRWILRAARRFPNDKDAMCLLGLIAEKQGNDRAALDYFTKALELNSYYAVARRDLGLLLYRVGRPAQAREQLRLYLEYAPQGEDTEDIRRFLNKIE